MLARMLEALDLIPSPGGRARELEQQNNKTSVGFHYAVAFWWRGLVKLGIEPMAWYLFGHC